ncbi:hypothetical protein D3C76_715800 [compost metagenome]
MGVHRHLVGVVVGRGFLPGTAPGRRARRVRGAGNRPAAGLVHPHWRTADEAVRAMVEVVGVEIVDGNAIATRADEVVGVGVLVEERLDCPHVLIGEVTPDHTFVLYRIVRFANAGKQHQTHVVELESRQNHQLCRLLHLAPLGIDVGHAGGLALAVVQVHPQHMGIGPQLEVGHLAQRRQDVHVGRGLGVHVAHVAAAETAEVARPHLRPVGVGVRPGGVCRWQVVGLVAQAGGGFFEQPCRHHVLLRGQWERVGTVRRVGVAALPFTDHLAFDGPGLA